MKENLSYTNPTLLTSGMGGFPPGDLYHWFPGKYLQWRAQSASEYERIDTWLTTGVDPFGPDAVRNPVGSIAPSIFALSQNYPNPFNPKTVISGQWPVTSVVRLVVYDVLGREVAVLADGRYPAGTYSFTFDGSKLASGVYFCRMTAGAFTLVRQMILMK